MRGMARLEEENRPIEAGEETTSKLLQRLTAAPVTIATRRESEPMAVTERPLTNKRKQLINSSFED
jgi:hypothetical protein